MAAPDFWDDAERAQAVADFMKQTLSETQWRVYSWGAGPGKDWGGRDGDAAVDAQIDEPYVPVRFHSCITELGMFELWCVSTTSEGRWKLEFSVRED